MDYITTKEAAEKWGITERYNVPIKQDKNFEKLNEPDIIKNSKLSGKKVHKNG